MQTRTRRQKEVLEFVTRYIANHGYEPSYQLIARHLGLSSKAGIGKHIAALEEQGLLQRRRENGSFKLTLGCSNGSSAESGAIEWVAGVRKNTDAFLTRPFTVPDFMLGGHKAEDLAAFHVPDDSMAEKCICEGDIVIIERRTHARDGDCIVATIKRKETVLRSYFRDGSRVELRPGADGYSPVRLAADQIVIHGIYRGLLRPGS